MNVVFLSPHFPPQFHLFCKSLREEGATVLGLGDVPEGDLAPEVREHLDAYYFVSDLTRHEDTVRALGFYTWKYGRLHRIDSLNEHWLEVEAKLREDFHLPGLSPAQTREFRSKRGMKPYFEKAGVACPGAEHYRSPDALRAFVKRIGFPIVLKPDVGVGAARTFSVHNDADLDAAVRFGLEGYLAEEYVQGKVVTYDGLTDRAGNVVFASSLAYGEGVMETVNRRSDMVYWTQRKMSPQLEAMGRRTVEAFGLKERFFHIEYFQLEDGSFRALEINLRPPGGFTTDMMNWSADADIYRLWAKVLTGKPVTPTSTERAHSVMHVARRNEKPYRHSHEEVLRELGDTVISHRRIAPILAGAMGDEAYLLRHADETRLHEAARFIQTLA